MENKKSSKYFNLSGSSWEKEVFLSMFFFLIKRTSYYIPLGYSGEEYAFQYINKNWYLNPKSNKNRFSKISYVHFADYNNLMDIRKVKDINSLVKTFINFDYKHKEFYARYMILDEVEREYLDHIIAPFKDKVAGIKKCHYFDNNQLEYISIILNTPFDSDIDLPCFKAGNMYKGMKINKQYSLVELGLLLDPVDAFDLRVPNRGTLKRLLDEIEYQIREEENNN